MPQAGGCSEAMQLLTLAFQAPLILNDGHEIYARLERGDDLIEIFQDLNTKFGDQRNGTAIQTVAKAWPALHREAVAQILRWALSKLDTEDRILIDWKGDAENPETVTKFELRDHRLLIEFAHPPGSLGA